MTPFGDGTYKPEPETPSLDFNLRLASLKSARQSVARIVREYGKGRVDEKLYKGVLYGLQTLLAFQKAEAEHEIERRLEEIEQAIAEGPER